MTAKTTLFKTLEANEYLKFINAEDDTAYVLKDLIFSDFDIVKTKVLVFLYLDNSLNSLIAYLNFLNTDHVLALLSNTLDTSLKNELEDEYLPNIVYDTSRAVILNYDLVDKRKNIFSLSYFKNLAYNTDLHDDLRLLLSTSGTTGSPKLVKLTEQNILQNALSIIDYLPINRDDIVPLNLPLYYSYGLSVLHSNAVAGGTIVCGLPDILSQHFWRLLNKLEFTSIAGVPFIYEMLRRIGFMKNSYPSLKYITQAGGNLSKNIKEKFNQYCLSNDIRFFVMYGQTEATARISYVLPEILSQKITSIGKPIKNGTIEIDAESGELIYKGPNVFVGYSEKREELGYISKIEALRTGDLAFEDDEGYYFIKGRLKRIVKVFGNRINLDELETFLKSNFNQGFLACVGVNDKLVLIAHSIDDIDEALYQKALYDTFKIHKGAIKFKYFNVLPKTKNNKTDYKTITSMYLDHK